MNVTVSDSNLDYIFCSVPEMDENLFGLFLFFHVSWAGAPTEKVCGTSATRGER